jgi:hypothetical protein
MSSNLAGFSYIYNALKFDIPFAESIRSVIDVVDQFVLTECYSQDETWNLCMELKEKYPDKIVLLRHPWVSHFTEIADLANWTLAHIKSDIRYVMELQSDEVIHERDLDELHRVPEVMERTDTEAARWNYNHFVASPEIVFPFVYSSAVRIVDRQSSWRVVNDGVEFKPRNLTEEKVLNTNITVYHYGKMKDPGKAWAKEWDFQNLFKDIGFPDPKMQEMKSKIGSEYCDYLFLFQEALKEGKMTIFQGTHPKVMQDRIKLFMNSGWEQLRSKVDERLTLL